MDIRSLSVESSRQIYSSVFATYCFGSRALSCARSAVMKLRWKSPQIHPSMYGSIPGNGDGIRHPGSVHPDRRGRRDLVERPDPADPVPRVLLARRLALALVALGEPRDEELLRQRRQQHPPGLTDLD